MKINGLFKALVWICALGVLAAVMCGCKSSKSSLSHFSGQSQSEQHSSGLEDSLAYKREYSSNSADFDEYEYSETGRIILTRDSAGKVEAIDWRIARSHRGVSTAYSAEASTSGLLHKQNAAGSASTSYSKSEETQKAQTDVDTAIPLEMRLGVACIALILIYVLFIIFKPHLCAWIKLLR